MKNTLIRFILLMLWTFLNADAQTSTPAYTCTRIDLDTKRKVEFIKLFDQSKYTQAIKLLQDYLDTAKCEQFAFTATQTGYDDKGVIKNTEARKNLQAYLWALSDIALAEMKAGKYADCISLTDSKLHEYPYNWIEMSGDKTLYKAFETNWSACKKKRLEGFTAEKTA